MKKSIKFKKKFLMASQKKMNLESNTSRADMITKSNARKSIISTGLKIKKKE